MLEREGRVIAICELVQGRDAYTPTLLPLVLIDLPNRRSNEDVSQDFPFYIYSEDGTERRETSPLHGSTASKAHYENDAITKWAYLPLRLCATATPGYRDRYAANLKRELPRIPFAPEFRIFARAGKKLTELHIGYENVDEFHLQRIEKRDVPFSLRVEKMKLTPNRRELIYNESLTLSGIPPEVFDYKLGNRSALEWVIDQYRISPDGQSDPNRPDDEDYILRLIGQVITVSLET